MSKAPSGIHTTSRGLLKRFAAEGIVTVEYGDGRTEDLGVKLVCRQDNYWGSPALALAVEASLNACESRALGLIRRLEERWPLEDNARALMAEFMAVHVVRTPAFKYFVRSVGEAAIRNERERSPRHPGRIAAATAVVRDPRSHANTVLHSVGRVASVFSSMQWTLVTFDDCLSTGDQPVVMLPSRSGVWTPASSLPPEGIANTVEVRFTLDPHTLLLLTWHDGPDSAQPVAGSFPAACSVNCALRAQALEQWIYRPGTKPPRLNGPVLRPHVDSIAPRVLSGYSPEAAGRSDRRREAQRVLGEMIENDAPRDRIRWTKIAA